MMAYERVKKKLAFSQIAPFEFKVALQVVLVEMGFDCVGEEDGFLLAISRKKGNIKQ